jgi:hypothetical protein
MKRRSAAFAAFLMLGSTLFAATIEYSTLVPKTAKSMAMGGVFSSVPTAEFSFYGNPAAFASKQNTFFFPSLDTWAYMRPSISNIQGLINSTSTGDLVAKALNLMEENGGTGLGLSLGLGYAGKGFAIGSYVTTDEFIEGRLLSAKAHSDTEADAILGFGIPLELGPMRLAIGADLRPFYRLSLFGDKARDPIAFADIISNMNDTNALMNSMLCDSFYGIVGDAGVTLSAWSLTFGLSARDLSPAWPMASMTVMDWVTQISNGSIPSPNSSDYAVFTPDITAGMAWQPELLPGIIDPALYVELADPIAVIQKAKGIGSVLNMVHAGAEIKLFKFLSVRGGVNRGWLSAGAGIKLLFLDVNAAVFTEELGSLPGDNPRSGLSAQVGIRF